MLEIADALNAVRDKYLFVLLLIVDDIGINYVCAAWLEY